MKYLLLILILLPFLGGLGLFVFPIEDTHRRNTFVMCLCSLVSVLALGMLGCVLRSGNNLRLVLAPIFGEDFSLVLHVDALSAVFVSIVAILWPITNLYAFEYMQHDRAQNRFFAFYTMAFGIMMGISFAGNLITLYLFSLGIRLSWKDELAVTVLDVGQGECVVLTSGPRAVMVDCGGS